MRSVLFTTYLADLEGKPSKVLSCFVSSHKLSSSELDAALVEVANAAVGPDRFHFVGYEADIAKVRDWLSQRDSVLHDRISSLVGGKTASIGFVEFSAIAGTHKVSDLHGTSLSVEWLKQEQNESLVEVFKAGGGEQRAPTGTHFSKTSKSHSDRFLRVSNVLEDGDRVRLTAFWLLPHIWKATVDHVIVDTSGIFSVAVTAIHEAMQLGGLEVAPNVWSHRSHEGVPEIPLHCAKSAIFLISASTSGGLAEKLVGRGAKREKIVTLFQLKSSPSSSEIVLCDLKGRDGKALEPIQNLAPQDCKFCKKNFHLIEIQGDQFSISPPSVSLVEIRGSDLSEKLRSLIGPLLGLGAFRAFLRRDGDRVATLGVDVEPILTAGTTPKNEFALVKHRAEWQSKKQRASNISVRHVVACGYPGTVQIANLIRDEIRRALRSPDRPTTLSSSDLRDQREEKGASSIVVCAAIDEDKELASVSRSLRDTQPDGTISYLSVATLFSSESDIRRLRSNLTHGLHGPGTFSFDCLFHLPIDCFEDQTSWDAELRGLQKVVAWADANDKDVPAEIEGRIKRLQQAPSSGLIADLFWPTPGGAPLRLRSDFALIADALRPPEATQADLFAVFLLVLFGLRTNTDLSRRLAYNAYERGVLAPSVFDRFNDGVLQACILRAARPKEMAYEACSEAISERMLAILMYAVPGQEVKERSEAAMEFVIALLTQRLSLHASHVQQFCQAVVDRSPKEHASVALVSEYILSQLS